MTSTTSRESRRHGSRILAGCALTALLASPLSAPAAMAAPAPEVSPIAGIATASVILPTKVTTSTTKTKIKTNLPSSATISRYGTRTSKKLTVKATGTKLHYKWQQRADAKTAWKTISGAKKSSYTVTSSTWNTSTQFRVIVTGKKGKATSKTVSVKVLQPTKTPAADAQKKFGLTGIRQGVDLSAWQDGANTSAITTWVGSTGFTLLRNGSGARPIHFAYTDPCTNKQTKTGSVPVVKDCAYAGFADAATKAKRGLGHYWFNGWISSIDKSSGDAFSGNYTPTKSADQFVAWLLSDGNYTTASTDPLVLDIEPGGSKTKTVNGKKVTQKLRAWTSSEALEFLNRVKTTLTNQGYHANLYVYMGSTRASAISAGNYVWKDVAGVAKLWVASWGTDNGRIPDAQPSVGPWDVNSAYGNREGWSIWQYSANVRIAGSWVGALDGDIAKASAWTPRS